MTKSLKIRPIKTKKDYETALAFIEKHFEAKQNSPENFILEVLSILVENYEEEHFPIEAPDPVEAIKFRMEQAGFTTHDLAVLMGGRNRVSEVFARKRSLTLNMMRSLNKEWGIPAQVLLNE